MPINVIDIVKAKNAQPFPICEDIDLLGGFQVVADLTARDAIPSGKRKVGMYARTISPSTMWTLVGGILNTNWQEVATADDKVKIDASDTTTGYLDAKIAVLGNIAKSILTPAGNEQLQLYVVPTESTAAITVAVATTGSDTPSVNRPAKITGGDYSAYPFATPQALFDSLPKMMKHTLAVSIGAGTFPGFAVEGFTFLVAPTITGTLGNWTPATGPTTGTATSGGAGQLTLTGAGWTVDNLVGKLLTITAGTGAGAIYAIRANTTDAIYCAYTLSTFDGTSQFAIQEPKTEVNTACASALTPSTGIFFQNTQSDLITGWPTLRNVAIVSTPAITGAGMRLNSACQITNCTVDATGIPFGIVVTPNGRGGGRCSHCSVTGGTYAFYFSGSTSGGVTGCVAIGAGTGAYFTGISTQGNLSGFCARNCSYGLRATGVVELGFFTSPTLLQGCGRGISGVRSKFLISTDLLIENSTTKTFDLTDCTIQRTAGTITGTGNTGWGMNLNGYGNILANQFATAPTITGTSGEVTVDGITDETWAYLSTVGNSATDAITGAKAVRQ